LHEQRIIEETIDQQEVNQIQLKMNMKQKSEQSKSSSMAKFLNSIGKKNTSSQLVVTTASKKKLVEEMTAYKSLAQREYNSIIANENDPNVVSVQ
jgi:pantothenate kinase